MERVDETTERWYSVETSHVIPLLNIARDLGVRETSALGSTWPLPNEKQFDSLPEIQVYVDSLTTSSEFKAAFPDYHERVFVKPAQVTASSRLVEARARKVKGQHQIIIPDHAVGFHSEFMREWYALHEVAHLVTTRHRSHGSPFQESLWKLVSIRWGVEVSTLLRFLVHKTGLL